MTRSDGSVVITANVDVSKADKDLAKLKNSIKKTEEEIEDLTSEKSAAEEKSVFSAAELDAEKAKLAQMKRDLEEIRSIAKDTSFSASARAEAKAAIPGKQAEIADQKARVSMLQAEFNKIDNAVQRYDERLSKAQRKLQKQTKAAGDLAGQINASARASQKMASAHEDAQKSLGRFNRRLKEVIRNAFVFAILGKALLALKEWMWQVAQTSEEAREAFSQLKGALLTMVQPLVEVLVPAFITLVKVLTLAAYRAAQIITSIFGQTVEEASAAANALNKETEALDGIGKAAKEASGSLAGFDEINTITTEDAAAAGTIAPSFDFDTIVADDKLNKMLDAIEAIGSALFAWKLSKTLLDGINTILKLGSKSIPLKFSVGITLMAAGAALTAENIASILKGEYENSDFTSVIKEAIAGIMIGAGFMAVAGVGWWAIPVAVALVMGITDIIVNWDNIKTMWKGIIDGIIAIFNGDPEGADQSFTQAVITWMGGDSFSMEVQKWLLEAILGEGTWEKLRKGFEDGTYSVFEALPRIAYLNINLTQKAFESLSKWLEDTFGLDMEDNMNALRQIFSGLREFVAGVFSQDWGRAWGGIGTIFKGFCNGIISMFESAINFIIRGVNWLISQMNKISFSVPDWVPGIGGKSLGINIPSISQAKLPRLATGAVVPPNREFMAILGDNKNETEVVSPLSTMKQALIEAMRESGFGGEINVTVVTTLDGREVARNQIKHINAMTQQAGKPVLLF